MELRSELWGRAAHEIAVQGEKLDRDAVVRSFVDMGHLPRIFNATNQYIEGRRGSGKTHLLSYFCEHVNLGFTENKSLAVYVDARSINLESDPTGAPRALAKSLYREFVLRIVEELQKFSLTHLWQNVVPTARSPVDERRG